MVLWSGCPVKWIQITTRRQIDPRIWTDCKLFYFLFYFGKHYSSTLLVLMSFEKCFAVYFPLKSVSVTFLVLTTPTAVYEALLHVIDLWNNSVYQLFMNFTLYLNHSHLIVGSKFRMELLKIFCGKQRGHRMSVSHSVNKMSLVGVNKCGTWLAYKMRIYLTIIST